MPRFLGGSELEGTPSGGSSVGVGGGGETGGEWMTHNSATTRASLVWDKSSSKLMMRMYSAVI